MIDVLFVVLVKDWYLIVLKSEASETCQSVDAWVIFPYLEKALDVIVGVLLPTIWLAVGDVIVGL